MHFNRLFLFVFTIHIYYLLLFVTITTNAAGVKEDVQMIMNTMNHSFAEYVKNGKYFNPETGAMFYVGRNKGFSDRIKLYFKKQYALTNPYFNINFCLQNMNSTCKEGILLCYESQLKAWYMRDAYNDNSTTLIKRKDPELKCENETHFGILVSADETHFTVKASLDAHDYEFEIPPPQSNENEIRCFVLNMGSNNSLETTITNLAGERLIYTGNAPVDFIQDESFFDEDTMNLWMLFIDFVPYYPPNLPYFPRPLYFRGSGDSCQMTAEFSTNTVHVCKQDMELLGSCETVNLDSADTDCTVTLRASQSVEEGTEKEKSQSTTNTQSKTETQTNEKGTTNELSIGYEIGGGIDIEMFAINAGWNLGFRHEWESKQIFSVEDRIEKSHTVGSSKTDTLKEVSEKERMLEMKIHRTDGGSVNLYQLVMYCGGDTVRYHKIYAVGEAEKKGDPQSSTVYVEYEMHNGTARPKLKEMDEKDHNNKNAPEGAIKNLGATKMHDDN